MLLGDGLAHLFSHEDDPAMESVAICGASHYWGEVTYRPGQVTCLFCVVNMLRFDARD